MFGPRLFSIYVNNLPTSVSSAEVHIYVDDTTVFVVGDSVDEVLQKLREASFQMNNWCSQNKLTVHAKEQRNNDNNQKIHRPTLTSKMGGDA